MNRIDRVTAILIQLQSKKIVKAQDIAARFNISLRTVYRDIKTLEEAGVPVLGESGVGYSIMEGYRLPPVMFTREEAAAFITAEKLVEKFTDLSTETSYKSAMFKVRAVLRSTEKDMLENIEEHIEVSRKMNPFGSGTGGNTLQLILKSISDKKLLRIRYAAFHSNEITDRKIEPVGIVYSGGYWHAIAFCRLRNDYRDFRTDRIRQIEPCEEHFDTSHPSLKTYLEEIARKEQLEKIVIRVDRSTEKYLHESKFYYGFVDETPVGETMEMTFLSPSLYYFMHWFLIFGHHAEIIRPDALADMARAHIEKLSKKFSLPVSC